MILTWELKCIVALPNKNISTIGFYHAAYATLFFITCSFDWVGGFERRAKISWVRS